MSKIKLDNTCDCCGESFDDTGFCRWHGEPFSKQADKELCYYCLAAIKPLAAINENYIIEFIGTHTKDILALSEMIEQGFEKKRSILSLKSIAKALGISKNTLKQRLKN